MFGEMKHIKLLAVSAMGIVLFATGCRRSELRGNGLQDNTGAIRYTVSGAQMQVSLKSGAEGADTLAVVSADGSRRMTLQRTVSPMTGLPSFAEDAASKSAPVTGDNVDSRYPNSLYVTSTLDGEEYFPAQQLVFVSREEGSSVSHWKTKNDYYWPEDSLTFWGWAPNEQVSGVDVTTVPEQMSFSYATPDSKGAGEDAKVQSDLIVATTTAAMKEKSSTAHLQFRHALSALTFRIGKANDCTVKSISLKGVRSTGTCSVTGETVTWSGLATPMDYTQNFNTVINENLVDDGTNLQPVDKSADAEATFMLIPQNSTSDNRITLEMVMVLKGTSDEITLSAVLDEATSGWQPGYTYAYTLSVLNGLDIEIDDKVSDDGKTKDNLTISNVGGRPAYIRALVVGYWVNASRDIVALWNPGDANVGTFVPATFTDADFSSDHWKRMPDGFYYYKHVLPGKTAIPDAQRLFTSYTAKESGKPKNLKLSDYLEIDIVSQAVVADDGKAAITTAWGAAAAEYVDALSE